MKKIAILASGNGTNAEKIIQYFQKKRTAVADVVIVNKKEAGVYARVGRLGVETIYAPASDFNNGRVMEILCEREIDFIVLAGFLLKVPADIVERFPRRIVNIHPALLPLHGGKGMYGERVHRDVIEHGDKLSGITIHYVDQHYDHGSTIKQATCPVLPGDTPDSLASRVHELEHRWFPVIIEQEIMKL